MDVFSIAGMISLLFTFSMILSYFFFDGLDLAVRFFTDSLCNVEKIRELFTVFMTGNVSMNLT